MKLENKIEKDLKTKNYIFVSDYYIFVWARVIIGSFVDWANIGIDQQRN